MRKAASVFAIFGLWLLIDSQPTLAADHPMIGEPAPAFDLATLDGSRVRSDDLRGQYIVLHFGAGW